MSDTVTIQKKEYECLRRCLNEAFEILEGLGVRELKAPPLSPQEKLELKYKNLLK